MGKLICDNISEIIADIVADYEKGRPIDKQDIFGQPARDAVKEIIYKLNHIVYAGYYVDRTYKIYNLSTTIASMTEDVAYNLNKQISLALHFDERMKGKNEEEINERVYTFWLEELEKIEERGADLDFHYSFELAKGENGWNVDDVSSDRTFLDGMMGGLISTIEGY